MLSVGNPGDDRSNVKTPNDMKGYKLFGRAARGQTAGVNVTVPFHRAVCSS